jgi:hypothetical protein
VKEQSAEAALGMLVEYLRRVGDGSR